MATKSFLKDVVIRDRSQAKQLLSALENADKKIAKEVILSKSLEEVRGNNIKKLFGKG